MNKKETEAYATLLQSVNRCNPLHVRKGEFLEMYNTTEACIVDFLKMMYDEHNKGFIDLPLFLKKHTWGYSLQEWEKAIQNDGVMKDYAWEPIFLNWKDDDKKILKTVCKILDFVTRFFGTTNRLQDVPWRLILDALKIYINNKENGNKSKKDD